MDSQACSIGQEGLFQLGKLLLDSDYRFTTITPLSHSRVMARNSHSNDQRSVEDTTLRDIFGWSRSFERTALPPRMISLLEESNAMEQVGACGTGQAARLRSKVRFSTIENALGDGHSCRTIYAHSAYPTTQSDAVFFGPDTYRFVALIERELDRRCANLPLRRIVDLGCGAGPGGIAAALAYNEAELLLADINPAALEYAIVNSRLAGIANVTAKQSDLFKKLDGDFDLIVANPPYLLDADARIYRHGGGDLGSGLSMRIVLEGIPRLSPDGMLILYTGIPIVDGKDVFSTPSSRPCARREFLIPTRKSIRTYLAKSLKTRVIKMSNA